MLEMLLALQVTLMGVLLLFPCMKLLFQLTKEDRRADDLAALELLRRELAIAERFEAGEQLFAQLEGKQVCYRFKDDRLVRQDGYVIFMEDVAQGYFLEEDGNIWMRWQRGGTWYEALLAK